MAEKDGVEVRVIAGEAMGVRSPVYTRTPTMFIDFTLQPNTQYHQTILESWNAFVDIIEGEGYFGIPNREPLVVECVGFIHSSLCIDQCIKPTHSTIKILT
ncbi:transcription cofactor [Lithospermum erythrorhizon]|uniref:Transcription cofactor n=1 Tax=Lithospermum erythrorhizon TaxID=34254 RepID=A0AAV3RBG6_LITER